jgi:hypothetical protein
MNNAVRSEEDNMEEIENYNLEGEEDLDFDEDECKEFKNTLSAVQYLGRMLMRVDKSLNRGIDNNEFFWMSGSIYNNTYSIQHELYRYRQAKTIHDEQLVQTVVSDLLEKIEDSFDNIIGEWSFVDKDEEHELYYLLQDIYYIQREYLKSKELIARYIDIELEDADEEY